MHRISKQWRGFLIQGKVLYVEDRAVITWWCVILGFLDSGSNEQLQKYNYFKMKKHREAFHFIDDDDLSL